MTGKQLATTQTRSVLVDMATKFGMEPAAFEATIRATCMPTGRDAPVATKEEFAAFLLVAKEYGLNPLTKEIYAFPRRGGGIVPVVSIDGWVNLVNTHPQFDGMEFNADEPDGKLVSVTCTIYRKDRQRATIVTEYLDECIRQTEPWKMKRRMLRHKALIQCARYAFGFSGIVDEDDAQVIAGGPVGAVAPPPPPSARVKPAEPQARQEPREEPQPEVRGTTEELPERGTQEEIHEAEIIGETMTLEETAQELDDRLGFAKTQEELQEAYDDFDEASFEGFEGGVELARALFDEHTDRIENDRRKAEAAAKPKSADDFPANDKLAEIKKQSDALKEKIIPVDKIEIRSDFRDADDYVNYVYGAIGLAKVGHFDLLQDVWNKTKDQRGALAEKGDLKKEVFYKLKDDLTDKLIQIDENAAGDESESTAAAPPPPKAEAPAEADEDGPLAAERPDPERDPVAAYDWDLKTSFASATTVQDVVNFWEDTRDYREKDLQPGPGKKATWSSLMMSRKGELRKK